MEKKRHCKWGWAANGKPLNELSEELQKRWLSKRIEVCTVIPEPCHNERVGQSTYCEECKKKAEEMNRRFCYYQNNRYGSYRGSGARENTRETRSGRD